jgi:hypothetical protein
MEIDFPPMNNRIYKYKYVWDTDPYYEDYWERFPKYRPGYKNSNKRLFSYQVRMYKTWKHNRKTQWKPNRNKRS